MPVPWIYPGDDFPDTSLALEEPNGLLAAGGDLSCASLTKAYQRGIFPWFEGDQPILWWSPAPRMVLKPEHVHISKSLKKSARKQGFSITFDEEFAAVINACAGKRAYSQGTWITEDMKEAYIEMHEQGFAHSVEIWKEGNLAGGLYGIGLDRIFFGESMFSKETDASKFAFCMLCKHLQFWGIKLLDCQLPNEHLLSLGASEMPRSEFEACLISYCQSPVKQIWRVNPDISLNNISAS